ncbi:MAG: type II secretion system F family protein [Nitrospiraceae bacterium]|nr:MAG: type II secretion system F family protein [Nitrospiraceae bacterium]
MPIFRYKGYDHAGAETEGVIEADGQRDAALKIKTQGVFPKVISEEVSSQKKVLFKKFSPLVLAGLTRQLSTLLSSGVPLIDAISSLSVEQKSEWKNLLIDVKERLAGGATLARAFEAYPDVFPDFYTGLIAAGESSGKLTDVLLKLSDFLENEINIKNKVKTALIYPIFMAVVSIAIVLFLFTFVIPKITKIFEDTATSLPIMTIILIWVSATLKKFWWLFIALAVAAILMFKKIKETRKDVIDAVLIKDPTGILMGLYMLRFTMTMGFLLSGGLPILQAMKLTGKSIGNVVLENRIIKAENHVTQGAKLSNSLEGFPPTLLQIISTGEETGKLPEVLQKTSESYEAEFDRKLHRMISLLEPALILLMGLVVGFIVVAVLMPIFELNEMMK